jgi:hypothetical protein
MCAGDATSPQGDAARWGAIRRVPRVKASQQDGENAGQPSKASGTADRGVSGLDIASIDATVERPSVAGPDGLRRTHNKVIPSSREARHNNRGSIFALKRTKRLKNNMFLLIRVYYHV